MSLKRILKFAEIISNDHDLFNKLSIYINSYIKKLSYYEPRNNENVPNVWRKNMDYSIEESSPYYGNVPEFLKKFPGGIKDWIKWRKKNKKNRYKKYDIKKRKACLEFIMKKAEENKLKEDLANLEHEQWMKWAKNILKSEDISEDRAKRWKEECFKPYSKLTEEMKDFDREWADKVLKILNKHNSIKKKSHFIPVGPDNTKNLSKSTSMYSNMNDYDSVDDFLEKSRHYDEDKLAINKLDYKDKK